MKTCFWNIFKYCPFEHQCKNNKAKAHSDNQKEEGEEIEKDLVQQ